MIKKYNQFIKENDEFIDDTMEEVQDDMIQGDQDIENNTMEEEAEEEAGDIYTSKLKELSKKLGVDIEDGKLEYKGKEIIFPSETEMYHVDRKKFKTSDEVVDFLQGNKEKESQQKNITESKSYKNRFKL